MSLQVELPTIYNNRKRNITIGQEVNSAAADFKTSEHSMGSHDQLLYGLMYRVRYFKVQVMVIYVLSPNPSFH